MEWSPIDTAPKDGKRVLLRPSMDPKREHSAGRWDSFQECWYMSDVGHLNGLWNPKEWRHIDETTP